MRKEKGARFTQSLFDFPLTVTLGDKRPEWGLTRWNGNNGLRFVPTDDDLYSIRGDKQRLVYKGRLRSHRFTILGDNAFEYDCILNKEPESNVVSLLMEGAENFDFLQQPDFVPDEFLKGSYAVYKKVTMIGEGTGKLCHINRPMIIDAKGRRVWGDLSIAGNCLNIIIPEKWLGEAVYPVIVDPVIGTATRGSQNLWNADPPRPWQPLCFEIDMPVNRFLVQQTINGNCTAHFYTNDDDWEAAGRPVLYSDNFNQPHLRRSRQEALIDLRVVSGRPRGWRAGTFTVADSIPAGSHIWFGLFTRYIWYPRFDYGIAFHNREWFGNSIPDVYPEYTGRAQTLNNNGFRLSMYFEYVSAQNFVRTLTQGVTLTDSRKLTVDYKRNAVEKVKPIATIKGLQKLYRKLYEAVKCVDYCNFAVRFLRSVKETAFCKELLRYGTVYFRGLFDNAEIKCEIRPGRTFLLTLTDTVKATGLAVSGLLLIVRIVTGVFVRDYILSRFRKAGQGIVLKSCVCREIVLESKIL